MYGYDENMLIGYSYPDNINVSPQYVTPVCDGENGLATMGYYNVASSASNEILDYMSPRDSAPSLIARSLSSHSLQTNNSHNANTNGWLSRLGLVSEVESGCSFVRKVFSAGDLQINVVQQYSRSDSPLSSESNSIIESMNRASPYSPEEKKERIERYRNKRNQRNFTKKIKYECRKTLADSRPRIRGRFARNDEIEKSSQPSQWSHEFGEEDDVDQVNWLNFLDSFSGTNSIKIE